jgi:hypothetical protein
MFKMRVDASSGAATYELMTLDEVAAIPPEPLALVMEAADLQTGILDASDELSALRTQVEAQALEIADLKAAVETLMSKGV